MNKEVGGQDRFQVAQTIHHLSCAKKIDLNPPKEVIAEAKKNGFAIYEVDANTRLGGLTRKVNPKPDEFIPKKPDLPAVHVHAQNVHDYFLDHALEHHWDNFASFTCARPPFPRLLITYDHLFTRKPSGETISTIRHIAVGVTERTPEHFSHYLRPEANPTGYDPKLAEKGRVELLELVSAAKPAIFLEMQIAIDGREMPGRFFVMIDAAGSVIVHGPFGYIVINDPKERTYLESVGLREATQEDFLARHGAIALATIQFMNCRNVEVLDNPPSRQQRRHAERTGERPPVVYKTLMIHPIGKRRARSSRGESGGGEERALHICRGHFKDYRQGSGLGRWHRHGLWWWSPMVRGSAAAGRVEKDYDVEAK
jgi:hypothetical protein